jgi:hypothetical protein
LPPEFLDALAVMRPGEVSRVIETPFGFHVLKRNPVPVRAELAGARIVIGYHNEGRHGVVQNERSRDEARARAEQIAALARSGSRTFASLVAEFSESADRAQGGDMGVWSVQDPGFMPREVEHLATLAEGATSEPIDTAPGFTILQRVPVTSRSTYAMRALRFPFDPTLPEGTPHSRAAAAHEATLFARAVREAPDQFDRMLREQCCDEVVQWTEGRGPVSVTPLLASLRFGEVASAPVESPSELAYLIPERVDPRSAQPLPAPRFELATAGAPDVETIVRTTDHISLARSARLLRDELPRRITLTAAQQQSFVAATNRLATAFETEPDVEATKVETWRAALAEIRRFLSEPEFSKFESSLNGWVTEKLMASAP